MRASCLALLTVIALAIGRSEAYEVDVDDHREARGAPDMPGDAVAASLRRAPDPGHQSAAAAILPERPVVLAAPRSPTSVGPQRCISPQAIIAIPPRSRAPPFVTDDAN